MNYYILEVEKNADDEYFITLPQDFLDRSDWQINDELSFKIEGESVKLRNASKELREAKSRNLP